MVDFHCFRDETYPEWGCFWHVSAFPDDRQQRMHPLATVVVLSVPPMRAEALVVLAIDDDTRRGALPELLDACRQKWPGIRLGKVARYAADEPRGALATAV